MRRILYLPAIAVRRVGKRSFVATVDGFSICTSRGRSPEIAAGRALDVFNVIWHEFACERPEKLDPAANSLRDKLLSLSAGGAP